MSTTHTPLRQSVESALAGIRQEIEYHQQAGRADSPARAAILTIETAAQTALASALTADDDALLPILGLFLDGLGDIRAVLTKTRLLAVYEIACREDSDVKHSERQAAIRAAMCNLTFPA